MRFLPIGILLFLIGTIAIAAAVYAQSVGAGCFEDVTANSTIEGEWTTDCNSEARQDSYAKFYNLTLTGDSDVTVTLSSDDADTYLYIRNGGETANPFLYENDDHAGSQSESQIAAALNAGSYTIEATTYGSGITGDFTLSVAVVNSSNGGATPTPGITPGAPTPTPTPTPLPPTDGFVAVSTGADHVCGIRGDGRAECWTLDASNLRDAPATGRTFVALDSFGNHTCGLRGDAEITCWNAPGAVAILPTPTATPITPAGDVGSRENPVPYGATVEVHNSDTDHWEITIVGVDPYADPEIARESSSNDTADEGDQFFLVRVKVKYLGTGSERFSDYRLKALGTSGTTYDSSCGVIPFDLPWGELFTGGEIEGSKCWQVASSEVASLVMFLEPDSYYGGGERVWFSLDFGNWRNSYAGERYELAWQAVGSTAYHAGRQASLPQLFVHCFDSATRERYLSVTAFGTTSLPLRTAGCPCVSLGTMKHQLTSLGSWT